MILKNFDFKLKEVNNIQNLAELLPVLEILQLSVNLLNVEVGPQYIIIARDTVDD